MGNEYGRSSARSHVVDNRIDEQAGFAIEPGMGFIQEEQLGAGQDDPGELHSSLHSVRRLFSPPVHGSSEADNLQHLVDPIF